MAVLKDAWARLVGVRSNVDAIDEAREVLANPAFEPLLTEEHQVEAVRQLRRKVRGLTLLDAVTLVRRASGAEDRTP